MENKVVLVTGSSRGIGKATIIKFASKGYNVVINYIDSKKEAKLKFIEEDFEFNNESDAMELKEFVEKEYGIKALVVEADISNELEVKSMINKSIDTFGRIDTLVNCAGIVFDRGIYESTIEEFENTLKVNIIGAFMVSREVIKYMKKGSSIINISSTNGTKVVAPESIDYNISKVGLQSLTRDLAFQFKPNIRVNAVDQMDSASRKMIERMAKATEQAYWLGISDGKAGKPLDVDERLDMTMKNGSELSKTVCDFMLKAYTGGYELGKIERIAFGKEVKK